MTWRQRMARRLDPTVAQWTVPREEPAPSPPPQRTANLWPAICEQFTLRVLASVHQVSGHLEAVEADEQDPQRLGRLYRIDHANTRIRRYAENLQVLLGRRVEDADRQTVALVDVVRAATSAIEYYPRIRIGHVVDLGVVEFAADDVIRVLTELLDNASRFSPPTSSVIVSAYVTEDGSVLLRVEDAGVGVKPEQLRALNAMLAGNAFAPVADNPAAHLGLVVVSHLARAHQLRVALTNRPSGGTTATVLVPGSLLCEMAPPSPPAPAASPPPVQRPTPGGRRPTIHGGGRQGSSQAPAAPAGTQGPTAHLTLVHHQPAGDRHRAETPDAALPSGLPRRVPESVRADVSPRAGTRPPQPESAPQRPSSSDRDTWPDETAAFAAGIAEAAAPTTAQPQGQLR